MSQHQPISGKKYNSVNSADPRAPAPYFLYTDGASRGNPGPAGAGIAIYDPQHRPIHEFAHYLGRTTNNVAEYSAFLLGIKHCLALGITSLHVRMDSKLIVGHLTQRWQVTKEHLQPFAEEIGRLSKKFQCFNLEHIRREGNTAADKLSNDGCDKGQYAGAPAVDVFREIPANSGAQSSNSNKSGLISKNHSSSVLPSKKNREFVEISDENFCDSVEAQPRCKQIFSSAATSAVKSQLLPAETKRE
jgi:ribonuclease HI